MKKKYIYQIIMEEYIKGYVEEYSKIVDVGGKGKAVKDKLVEAYKKKIEELVEGNKDKLSEENKEKLDEENKKIEESYKDKLGKEWDEKNGEIEKRINKKLEKLKKLNESKKLDETKYKEVIKNIETITDKGHYRELYKISIKRLRQIWLENGEEYLDGYLNENGIPIDEEDGDNGDNRGNKPQENEEKIYLSNNNGRIYKRICRRIFKNSRRRWQRKSS